MIVQKCSNGRYVNNTWALIHIYICTLRQMNKNTNDTSSLSTKLSYKYTLLFNVLGISYQW